MLTELECADEFAKDEDAKIIIKGKNAGVAHIYNRLPVTLRLTNGDENFDFATDVNVTDWLPGDFKETIQFRIPKRAKAGKYELSLAIGGGDYPVVTVANEGEHRNGYFVLGDITVK